MGLLHNFQKYGLYTTYLLLNLKNINKELQDFLDRNTHVFYAARLIGSYTAIIYVVSTNPLELAEKLKEIRTVIKEDLLNIDLLHMEKVHKYVQFPVQELP